MNIYVGNLSVDAKDEMIKQAFEAFGQVTSAKVIKDKYTGQSKAGRANPCSDVYKGVFRCNC